MTRRQRAAITIPPEAEWPDPTAAADAPLAEIADEVVELDTVELTQSCSLYVQPPYPHTDTIGRRFIYGKTEFACGGVYRVEANAALFQHYGGGWNDVAKRSVSESSFARAIAAQYCGTPYTPYQFVVYGYGRYKSHWYSGWTALPGRWSGVRTIGC